MNPLEEKNGDLYRGRVVGPASPAGIRHTSLYRRDRAVVDEYRGTFGDVDLTDEQLKDAIKKAIQQVKWYDEMMLAK